MSTLDALKQVLTMAAGAKDATLSEQAMFSVAAAIVMLSESQEKLAATQGQLAAVVASIQAQDAARDAAFDKLGEAVGTLAGHINRVASAAQEQMQRARERAEASAAKAQAAGVPIVPIRVVKVDGP